MSSAEIKIDKKLSQFFTGDFAKDLRRVVKGIKNLAIRTYQEEVPVDLGDARKSVGVTEVGDYGFVVGAKATNNGYDYPRAVALGTGIYKGTVTSASSGTSLSATQRGRNYSDKDRAMFAGMAKRGVKFNIRPNPFHLRAKARLVPLIYYYITDEITFLSHAKT